MMSSFATKLLSQLIKEVVTDRFKRMARDEKLTKFLSTRLDPAQLVDYHIRSEAEALRLASERFMRGLTGGRLECALNESAQRIQVEFQNLFGTEVFPIIQTDAPISARHRWLRSRVEFYSKWVSVRGEVDDLQALVSLAFRTAKNFSKYLQEMYSADETLAEEIQRAVNPMYRLLMKKQLELESEQTREVWAQFMKAHFKSTKELPEV